MALLTAKNQTKDQCRILVYRLLDAIRELKQSGFEGCQKLGRTLDAVRPRETLHATDLFLPGIECSAVRASANFAFQGVPIVIGDVSCQKGGGRVTGMCDEVAFELDLAARPDGWVECAVAVDGLEVLHFFLERLYEEFEFFPPGHSGKAPPMEAPGRIGKRLTWAQLRAAEWPSIAQTGYLTVEMVER